MTERSVQMTDAIDHFLALFLRRSLKGHTPPLWPQDWPLVDDFHEAVFARIAYHGVALALLRDPAKLADWPEPVRDRIRDEARSQSFWEMGHRGVLGQLLASLHAAGIASAITKGTALAYSVYPDPAMRRRGDSDVLVGQVSREAVRKALSENGFQQVGDARPLQESWAIHCGMGFTHVFDLHWRINASAAIAQRLEGGGIGTRTVPLPRLSDESLAIAPADNLILVAINRASHETFGYQSGDAKVFERDRLIWAIDLDLLCASFGPQDWQHLLDTARASGTSPIILSALHSAEATLGTEIPADIAAGLARQAGDAKLLTYFGAMPGFDRLRLDLAASPTMVDKFRLVRYVLFPGTEVLHERFPETTHWPVPVLQARRLIAGLGKLARKRA